MKRKSKPKGELEAKHFTEDCRTLLGAFLDCYGYQYQGTYRVKIAENVEFAKDSHYVLASCEGNVLYLDLIVRQSADEGIRVSLNQVLWYNGIRSLVKPKTTCTEQLIAFVRDSGALCEPWLTGIPSDLDDRYCYRMNSPDEFLNAFRGERV